MEFVTKSLRFGPMDECDREELLDLLTDKIVSRTYMLPEYREREEAEPLFRRLVALSRDPGRYVSGIYLDNRLIGIMNETDIQGKQIEMGYAFLPGFHNRGYATESFKGAIGYLFSQGFETVIAGAFRENAASIRVMEKCGMVLQEQEDQIEYRGKLHDCVYYAISRDEKRPYYEAYDDRYSQVHSKGLQWSTEEPTPILGELLREFNVSHKEKLLELGCGEGRDAWPLLKQGYDVLATDISREVIRYDREKWPEYADRFAVLDCISGEIPEKFDFIYAVAVVHMLTDDRHRDAFYSFIRKHLKPGGVALVCSMGDGVNGHCSDPCYAFELQERTHQQTGRTVRIASTSCRMVSFGTFREELERNGLRILRDGITQAMPDFNSLMYAVVKGADYDL